LKYAILRTGNRPSLARPYYF